MANGENIMTDERAHAGAGGKSLCREELSAGTAAIYRTSKNHLHSQL